VPFESLSEQQFIKKLTEITEANISDENFGVSQLAKELGMSRVTLHRKIKSIIKKSVSTFIRETRLKRSLELLQKKAGTVSEIAYSVGFGSPPYFTKCFRDYYGYSPGEVLKSDFTLNEQQKIEKGKRKNKRQKTVAILIIVLSIAIVSVWVTQNKSEKYQENSLAVLPFHDESPGGEIKIISGIRQEIQNKLEEIAGLNIVSRILTEQYRSQESDLKKIARELNVKYFLVGNGQTINGKTKLWIGLIDAQSETEIWSSCFEEIADNETIWDVYKDVAESVASKLQVSVSPEEKMNILLMETKNPLAYNFYLQGVAIMDVVTFRPDLNDIFSAKKMFEMAINEDSTFSAAYTALAAIYSSKLGAFQNFSFYEQNSFMDSSLMIADKALLLNPDDAWAWSIKSNYYQFKGMFEESEKYYQVYLDKKISRDMGFYVGQFHRYHGMGKRFEAIQAFYHYLEFKPPLLAIPPNMYFVIDDMTFLGLNELAGKYNLERFEFGKDSLNYFLHQIRIEHFAGNFEKAGETMNLAFKIAPEENLCFSFAILNSIFREDYADGLNYALKWEETVKKISGIDFWNHMEAGFIYLKNGMQEKAETHLTGKMYSNLNSIKQNRPSAQLYESHFNLACIYAALNDTVNAKIYLNQIGNAGTNYVWLYKMMKYHTMLENVRKTPEFKKTFAFLEEKYLEEYENTKRLLKRKGIKV
jgi:AraC-like DNA-binding protein/TolB-like protein